jgi:hypothetical protein
MISTTETRSSSAIRLRFASRRLAAEAAPLCALIAAAGVVYAQALHTAPNYDEGNYLAGLNDLRHGFALGRDVYPDQPPGWYLLLRLLAWICGYSLVGVRAGILAIALLGLVAAWACARRLGPLPAFGAAGVLAIAPPYPALATQIEGDGPAAVLALVAIAVAVWAYRERTSRAGAVVVGAVLACAVSIKLSALTAVPPIAALALLGHDRIRRLLLPLAGFAAVLAAEAVAFRNELGPVLHGVIAVHASALHSAHWSRSVNVHRLVHFLEWHTPFAWLVLAAVIVSIAFVRSRVLGSFWLFVPAAAAFVLALKPLIDHHLVILAAAVALPAGTALGLAAARLRRETAAAVALACVGLVAAGLYQQGHRLALGVRSEPEWILWAAGRLRAETTPREIIASDYPIVAYYAHRELVPDLVDTSFTRFDVGELTAPRVLREIDRYHVRAAALGRVLYGDPAIRAGFARRFRRRIAHGFIVLYLGRRSP